MPATRLVAPLLLLLAAVQLAGWPGLSAPVGASPSAVKCSDFPNQAAAQQYLRGDPTDPDGIAGKDGVACETLPCPCDVEPVFPWTPTPSPSPSPSPSPTPSPSPDPSVPTGLEPPGSGGISRIGTPSAIEPLPAGIRLPFNGHAHYETYAGHTPEYARDITPKRPGAWDGTVLAAANGKVLFAGARDATSFCPFAPNGEQLEVRIEHYLGGQRYVSAYAHLSEISVQAGDEVSGGDPIGVYGSTGCSTGAHLHFELSRGGTPGDPFSSGTNLWIDGLPGIGSVGTTAGGGDAFGRGTETGAIPRHSNEGCPQPVWDTVRWDPAVRAVPVCPGAVRVPA